MLYPHLLAFHHVAREGKRVKPARLLVPIPPLLTHHRLEKNQNAVSNKSTKGEWKRGIESGINGDVEWEEEQQTDSTDYLLPTGVALRHSTSCESHADTLAS